mmetsp:Transcript_36594/g.62124  ORF Transcript_36594/g.62124 Transcript_36594/m.62124 type:complete len:256 (-) Transcript_36594:63-830(-)
MWWRHAAVSLLGAWRRVPQSDSGRTRRANVGVQRKSAVGRGRRLRRLAPLQPQRPGGGCVPAEARSHRRCVPWQRRSAHPRQHHRRGLPQGHERKHPEPRLRPPRRVLPHGAARLPGRPQARRAPTPARALLSPRKGRRRRGGRERGFRLGHCCCRGRGGCVRGAVSSRRVCGDKRRWRAQQQRGCGARALGASNRELRGKDFFFFFRAFLLSKSHIQMLILTRSLIFDVVHISYSHNTSTGPPVYVVHFCFIPC